MSTANKGVVRRFFEAWGRQDLEVAPRMVTEDFLNNSSMSQGREGVHSKGQYWFSAFPKSRVSIEELLADGDKVVARVTTNATHRGEFFGASPTGNPVEVSQIDIFRVDNGPIAEAWPARLPGRLLPPRARR